ncbi:hypothetical protein [Prosthecobacter sp.]|uniref:hypothetical protein n=1 Tax=Prosthecobacter sp. TaxID=1965333 RepID=UPI0037CA8A07
MNELIQQIIRQLLAVCGAWFAAHNISGDSTESIVLGLVMVGIAVAWSACAKWLKIEYKVSEGIPHEAMIRALVGSLVSQGITAASTYLAIDANHPELFGVALLNAAASKAGLHQKLAGAPVAKVLIGCLCVISLSSCAGMTAFLASNAGQATIALADLGLNLAAAKGKITPGDNVAIQRGLAIVTNPADPTSIKVFSLAELGLQTAVNKGVIKQGDALLIQEGAAIIKNAVIAPQLLEAKQPVKVQPTASVKPRHNQLKPELHNEDSGPGCMQLADRIPLYGERVAFMLSTAEIRN